MGFMARWRARQCVQLFCLCFWTTCHLAAGVDYIDASALAPVYHHLEHELQLLDPSNIQLHEDLASALLSWQQVALEGGEGRVGASTYNVTVAPLQVNDGDYITITVSCSTPAYGDWIGLWSPSSANFSTTVPAKYMWLDSNRQYNASAAANGTGVATVRMQLINMRADYRVVFLRGGTGKNALAMSASPVITFADYNQALRARVIPGADEDSMTIRWTSNSGLGQPTLYWSSTSGGPYQSVNATSEHMSQSELCGSPATGKGWRDLGWAHSATLTGLHSIGAGKLIYYRYGDGISGLHNETSFRIPPPPGQSYPTTIIAFGDLGRGTPDYEADDVITWSHYGDAALNTSRALIAEVNQVMAAATELEPIERSNQHSSTLPATGTAGSMDAIFHIGDISYATGYLSIWDWYLFMMEPIISRIPYGITVGNHEAGWYNGAHGSFFSEADSGGECGVATQHVIPLPPPATVDRPWYSWQVGSFFMIGMSSEHDFRIGSAQYSWLEATLAAVNRSATPFIILSTHRPMYIDSTYYGSPTADIDVAQLLQDNIEHLLAKYKVTLAIYGHNHSVQRLSAAYANKTVLQSIPVLLEDGNTTNLYDRPNATVHMVVGTGGAGFTANNHDAASKPEWSERVFFSWGYARIRAVNSTRLEWEFVDSSNRSVVDRMAINQDLDQEWVGGGSDTPSNNRPSGVIVIIGGIIGSLAGIGLLAWIFLVWKTGSLSLARPVAYNTDGDEFGDRKLMQFRLDGRGGQYSRAVSTAAGDYCGEYDDGNAADNGTPSAVSFTPAAVRDWGRNANANSSNSNNNNNGNSNSSRETSGRTGRRSGSSYGTSSGSGPSSPAAHHATHQSHRAVSFTDGGGGTSAGGPAFDAKAIAAGERTPFGASYTAV